MDPAKLSTLPVAMIIGFLGISTLPGLPSSLITNETRQAFIALWQIYPLCVGVVHQVLSFAARTLGCAPKSQDDATRIKAARKVYKQILSITGVMHLGIIAILASPQLRQALLGASSEALSYETVFRAMSPFAPRQIEELAEGTQILLQYDMYCGIAAASVWAIALSSAAAGSSLVAAVQTSIKLLVRSLLVGPGGAVLWAFWDREEEMAAPVETAKKRA